MRYDDCVMPCSSALRSVSITQLTKSENTASSSWVTNARGSWLNYTSPITTDSPWLVISLTASATSFVPAKMVLQSPASKAESASLLVGLMRILLL